MIDNWAKGLFWLWVVGATAWLIAVTFVVYQETTAFSLHLSDNEWASFILLWTLPPMLTFGVYLVLLWLGQHMTTKDAGRWDRKGPASARRLSPRG